MIERTKPVTICSSCEAKDRVADPGALMLRVWRLIYSALQDDADAAGNVLDETGDCTVCLRAATLFLAAEVGHLQTEVLGHDDALRRMGSLIEKILVK
jgi:hypothetical protein